MAYFDSPKNSAMWEKEMVGLRAERERRESGGFKPNEIAEEKKMESKSVRENDSRHRAITLKELEEIDARMSGVRRVRRPTRPRERTMDMQQGTQKAASPQRGL